MSIHIDSSGRTKQLVTRLLGHHRVVVLDADLQLGQEVLEAVAGCFRTTPNTLKVSGGEVRGVENAQSSDDSVLHVIQPFDASDYAVLDAARRFAIG